MKRNEFLKTTGILTGGIVLNKFAYASGMLAGYTSQRPPLAKRHFYSKSVEAMIKEFKKNVKNPELGWLFENCFPNTLDTTVYFEMKGNKPDSYIITGDIDAMWLRDSSAQVWPYLPEINKDRPLKDLVAGLINRQTQYILKDPYANAFYKDENKLGEWKTDETTMLPGVHERKWEIDSLCYPIRLAYHYWKTSKDQSPFDEEWVKAIRLTLKVFKEQQRKDNLGPYHFRRETLKPTDTLPMMGYGFPVKPNGLICSMFRPSDDATIYPFLIPSNFFAVVSLKQAAIMLKEIHQQNSLAQELNDLASEVASAIQEHAIVKHPKYGEMYAFEINGMGSYNLMDDANVPSLVSLPYLDAVEPSDPIYINTRNYCLSEDNPFYFKGKAAAGVGGPHVGQDMVWPLGIIMRGLTSTNDQEIKESIQLLMKTHADTGFVHESFHKDDATNFTRKWFAWANTIFGEFLWKIYQEKPHLLKV
ncbi:glycoside hydrolase family 125 protein [Pedobacter arcticus]|uniref:glycoside hydrolase family 125 protein n=1 Tax=Pedobacter arcticus TaxID=752140 RepID=UPI0002E6D0AB|nr:glycoside hydrolase family 125 protein [Pedobacter arcticus]